MARTRPNPPAIRRGGAVEQQIRQAQREGLFDDLPGHGKPLENLEDVYDPGWWAASLVKRERISMLPPALELRRKVERELARIGSLPGEHTARKALEALNVEIARTNSTVTEGPGTDIARLDVDALLARWREHAQ